MRTPGAKGKPKNTEQLLEMLKDAAEREGLEFTHTLTDKLVTKAEQEAEKLGLTAEQIKASGEAARAKFSKLELDLDDDEVDTYECGNCGASMGAKLAKCPECEATLNW